MIVVGMATMAGRMDYVPKIVSSFLPHVDRINIHVSDYHRETLERLISGSSKVTYTKSWQNKGDQQKYNLLQHELNDSYYFSIDDDIIYPDDYVPKMIQLLSEHKNKIIACVHGANFNPNLPVRGFMAKRTYHHFRSALAEKSFVTLPGTGTVAFHTSAFSISPEEMPVNNMADIYVGAKAAKDKVKCIAIKRPARWLNSYPVVGTPIYKNRGGIMGEMEKVIQDNIEHFRSI
jgi:hypothetical protein